MIKKLLKVLAVIDKTIAAILKYVTITLFVAIALIVTANVLLRILPITSLHWTDEIVEMCFAGLVFYGAAGVWMLHGHFSVGDWIGKRVRRERTRSAYRLLIELITLVFAAVFFYYSMNLMGRAHEVSSVFQIPKKVFYSCMPISSAIMIAYSLVFVVRSAIGVINPKMLSEIEQLRE
ncbi:MAG TPA: TRAP transporter small permease subunit [Spirochaetia bacterium]|nr:TRAP transporter small permease subunit [Spirochaetia bacterium]